jgi:hypothetical protein
MLSDEQLMLDFQAGRTQAFEELFERYRNPLYGFFRRRLTNVARAEDLTQETFIVVIRGTERYEPRAKIPDVSLCHCVEVALDGTTETGQGRPRYRRNAGTPTGSQPTSGAMDSRSAGKLGSGSPGSFDAA